MLELLDTAVIQLDAACCIVSMNQAAENCLGNSRQHVVGACLPDAAPLPQDMLEALRGVHIDSGPHHLRDCQLPGGVYECMIQPLQDGGFLLELHDMQMERQVSQIQQREIQTGMLDLLRRNLGHELRNPLGGIRGAAQMLGEELADEEQVLLANLIMREVDRIEELIRRFGRPRLTRSKADIHQVLDEAIDVLLAESRGKFEVLRDYDPSIPLLPGDASALRQVSLNLLRNAQQAGARHLKMKTRIEHGSALMQPGQSTLARVDFEDDGEGVPEELRAFLFLPLVTGRRDGTGLGLALAQQIAAAHGGLLSFEPLAMGSRFSLRLPLNALASESARSMND